MLNLGIERGQRATVGAALLRQLSRSRPRNAANYARK